MNEENQKKVLAKIEQFLDTQRQFLYPQSVIMFRLKLIYCSFNKLLKREMLYAEYLTFELLVGLTLDVSSNGKRLDILFSYKSGDIGTALPEQSILNILQRRGVISNILFYTGEEEQAENLTNFRARAEEIAMEKAKKNGIGIVSIYNCFQGNFQYSGKNYQVIGYIEDLKLRWLSIFKDDNIEIQMSPGTKNKREEGVFRDEIELKDWMISILNEWLLDKQPVQFEWLSEKKSKGQKGSYLLKAFKEMSEISVDSSFEGEPHVFRWREEMLTTQCKSSFLLPKQDVEDLINRSGLKIPRDAEFIELSSEEEYTPTPCLKVRYIHTIPDMDFDPSIDIPLVYWNPGKIIIEEDFCVFYIDPENRKVISEYRKWRPIKEK